VELHGGVIIGLALVKELVELHGGVISVASELGKGSAFTVRLPLGKEHLPVEEIVVGEITVGAKHPLQKVEMHVDEFTGDASPLQPQLIPNKHQSINNEIILIVEDNPDVRAYIREQLETHYAVFEAANGEEGIAGAQEVIPDLIITDVMMPEMDGYQFSKQIRRDEKTSHIPIIMLTAKAALDDKIEGLETGVDAYLTKPFSAKELTVRVRNLILQRQQLRRRFSRETVIKPSEVAVSSIDQVFLEKVLASVEERFEDPQFNVECLAETVNMSVSQLNRKLGALIDQPSGQLIRSLRLQRAADLLKQNAGTVAEICYRVGFSDQANFTRAFKKQFGVAPSEFRQG
jgi:DNA-binding response OmpR family regulator